MTIGATWTKGRARLALALVACALLLRALLPAGWMPQATATGITLSWCDESGTRADVPEEARALLAEAMGTPEPAKQKAAGDGPCVFASAALPVAIAEIPALPLPPLRSAGVAPVSTGAAPGCGLAAPPPHSTGPPSLS